MTQNCLNIKTIQMLHTSNVCSQLLSFKVISVLFLILKTFNAVFQQILQRKIDLKISLDKSKQQNESSPNSLSTSSNGSIDN